MKKKKDHELISVEDCIDELIYGTGKSVVWHEVNGKRMSDEEYAAMIGEEYAADPPTGYSAEEIKKYGHRCTFRHGLFSK